MGTNIHERHRSDAGKGSNPPAGPDKLGGSTHALRAGKDGTSPRRNYQPDESRTREEGRDDHRNGSDHD
jgi:hypothetical protein